MNRSEKGTHMLRIVPQAIPGDNGDTYRRAVEEVQQALQRAVAVHVPADASFRDQETALLASGQRRVPLGVGRHAAGDGGCPA